MRRESFTYFIKKPDSKRRSFSIVKRSNLTRKSSTLTLPELNKINADLSTGTISQSKAEQHVKELLFTLNKKEKKLRGEILITEDDSKAVEFYLSSRYPSAKKRKELDFKSIENEVRRVVKVCSGLNFQSSPKEEFEDRIFNLDKKVQKKYASRLNSILKTFRRDFKVEYLTESKKRLISHLSLDELHDVCLQVPREYALLFKAIFATGARTGEAYSFNLRDINENGLEIAQQLKRDKTVQTTKNKVERTAIIIPALRKSLIEFIELDKKPDRYKATKLLRKITSKLFKDKTKHISLHGLRHSYAIHLISSGVDIASVAQFLGDSIQTAQDYYIGKKASSLAIERAANLLK